MKETETDREDIKTELINSLIDHSFRLAAIAKEKQTNVESVIYVDKDGNDAIAYVYDFKTVKMTTATAFDKLAQDNYGDPDLGPLISYYNKIQFEHKISAGSEIKIPVLEQRRSNQNNRIYAPPQMHDNYGSDIAIGEDGDFAVVGGDLAVITGQGNLLQAITNRLATAAEKRIRMGAYGIRSSIGDPMAVSSYLYGSIERTILEDPRVESIESISFEGRGDSLFVSVTYTDINGNKDEYMGEV